MQSLHAGVDFIFDHFDHASKWKFDSNSIITLVTKDEASLIKLFDKLKNSGAVITPFYEPDVDNQMTAFAILGTPEYRKKLSHLPLALKGKNKLQLQNS